MNRSRYLAVALSCAMMALPAAAAKKPAVKKALSVAMPEDSAVAFDKSESIILTMGRALNIALENNLTVLQARQGVESARGKSKAAHSALGPMLKATGALDAYDNVPNTPDNSAAARVDLTQSKGAGTRYTPYVTELMEDSKVFADVEFILSQYREKLYRDTYVRLQKVSEREKR